MMYTNVISCVTNNGYSSEFFDIQRDIRQGCPLSALLFILAVEILSINIQNDNNIKGITIHNKEIKLTQLADDTTLFLNNIESLQKSLDTLNKFHSCSGLKLNYSKTEILPIGQAIGLDTLPVTLVKKANSLGIWYFDNIDEIIKHNHIMKCNDIEKLLINWKKRKLTLIGKTTVIKSLIVSKISYVISNLDTPEWFVNKIQKLILDFLWDGKPPKIKNVTMMNTVDKGGLRIPNIEMLVKSQKIAWIKRMVNNSNAAWMQLLLTFLPEMNFQHILKASIDPARLADYIPNFYRQILWAWFETSPTPTSALEIRRQILWFNKHIRIDNKPIFDKHMYNKGVCCINDLLDQNGNILKYNELKNLMNINIDQFYYMKLIDAIPRKWRRALLNCNFPLNTINNNEDPHIRINNIDKNITQVKTRDIYLFLLNEIETRPSCIEAWNIRLNTQLSLNEWSLIFCLPKCTVRDTKVLEIQFKILHRCYATNSIISKWDTAKTEVCIECNQKANILHNFVSCTNVKVFWDSIMQHIRTMSVLIPTELTPEIIIFGLYKYAKYDAFNHILLYAKYYIHTQYIFSKMLSTNGFFNYYSYVLMVEKQRYTENNDLPQFFSRFRSVLSLLTA